MSKNRIQGRTALVTGANRGIGLAVTKALLNAGVRRVYAAARRPETLAPLVEEFGDRVVPVGDRELIVFSSREKPEWSDTVTVTVYY